MCWFLRTPPNASGSVVSLALWHACFVFHWPLWPRTKNMDHMSHLYCLQTFRQFQSLVLINQPPKILCMFLSRGEDHACRFKGMECWPEVYAHTYQDARRQAESHLWKPCGQWISCMLTPSPAFYWIWSPAMSILAEEGDSCQFPSLCSLSGVWFAFATPLPKKHPEASYSQRCPLGLRCPYAHGAKVGTCWNMLEEDVALKCQIDSGSLLRHRIPICS